MSEQYRCPVCNWEPKKKEEIEREHCPNCLSGIHAFDEDELECGGTLEPVSIWVKPDNSWDILQRCSFCGEMHSTAVREDDSPVKLLSIAARPLSAPPFPLERMEELTKLMGGRGDMGGYYDEQGE